MDHQVQIAKLRFVEGKDVPDGLYALSCEPDLRVRIFSGCLIDGVRYHTADREKYRRTQNSGVMAEGSHNEDYIDFYGCLKQIIELQYNSDFSDRRTVVLFRCDWFDTNGKKSRMKDDGFFRSINHGIIWYNDDPFILATQATKVFYLKDTKHADDSKNAESWRIVHKFSHRHLWNVAENDSDERPNDSILSYQDDKCEAFQVQGYLDRELPDDEEKLESKQPDDEDCFQVDATEVDKLRSQRREQMEEIDQSDDDDETGWQYASDNEGPSTPLEDDEDSDDD